MKFSQIYYFLKPFIPRRVQIGVRRMVVSRKRARYAGVWPIDERAGSPPEGWTGWPEGKKFALVLTHDVETARGQENSRKLMELEEKLGFRSSFGFVPERYPVSADLRKDLESRGFEVSVHGLLHDGLYYRSRETFSGRAARINRYINDWGATGFRSPSMQHNLDWIHDLNIEYDSSTFDTDPFEPQSDGVGTIFPFWVRKNPGDRGYLELPYTLPQDHTLFVIMQEKFIDIWKKKLDWIAEKGGMALLITHPDYMHFDLTKKTQEEYPAHFYEDFLGYIRTKYDGEYWHSSPGGMARIWAEKYRPDYRREPITEGTWPISNMENKIGPVTGSYPARMVTESQVDQKEENVKRACFVYYARFNGSAILYREAKALKERGFEVDLICLRDDSKDKIVRFFDGLKLYGIQARPEREKSSIVYFLRLAAFSVKCTLLLSILGVRKRYAIIHVTTPPDVLVFSGILPKLLGARVIMDIHDIGPEMYMRKLNVGENSLVVKSLKFMEKISAKFADHIITVTDIWKDKIAKRSAIPSKCTVLLNVPDENIFNRLPPGIQVERDAINIYYHGSLEEHFGVDTLLKAMPKIKELVPKATLHIYGSGRLKDQLQALARLNKIDDSVNFHGSVPFYDLPEILKDADLGVVPTKGSVFSDEALSMKSLEYISLGIPIVISQTKVHNMYYDPSMVTFFKPGDEEELAASVVGLCKSMEKRKYLADNAQKFLKEHGWNESKKVYFAMIDQLTG